MKKFLWSFILTKGLPTKGWDFNDDLKFFKYNNMKVKGTEVLPTNSNFIIPISLQHNVVKCRPLIFLTMFSVGSNSWNLT